MKILILGGTGSIGSAVTADLVAHQHQVIGLCRSEVSARKLSELGGQPWRGDLRAPSSWRAALAGVDVVTQLASTFGTDMASVDAAAMACLRAEARVRPSNQPLRVIYTGGCWIYGETGDHAACETSPQRPIPAFSWMQVSASLLLRAPNLSCAVVHPAMVYHEDGGGVFARMLDQAAAGLPLEVWGSIHTRWPLVHRRDLARAYRMLAEQAQLTGHFNVAAQSGIPVRDILAEILTRHPHDGAYLVRNRKYVMFKYGAWAEGPTLDQQMRAEKIRQSCGWQPEVADFTQAAF
ncbi:NAD-dependent epimerase/dehydratase family protein [Pseudophaeobacter sp.]|uniref:NAD-dependent epimerase/dehydratase family protein n=1 Tax=Pseudophaeobacter sp. TaxID=1971739 RepID=UPI003A9734E2